MLDTSTTVGELPDAAFAANRARFAEASGVSTNGESEVATQTTRTYRVTCGLRASTHDEPVSTPGGRRVKPRLDKHQVSPARAPPCMDEESGDGTCESTITFSGGELSPFRKETVNTEIRIFPQAVASSFPSPSPHPSPPRAAAPSRFSATAPLSPRLIAATHDAASASHSTAKHMPNRAKLSTINVEWAPIATAANSAHAASSATVAPTGHPLTGDPLATIASLHHVSTTATAMSTAAAACVQQAAATTMAAALARAKSSSMAAEAARLAAVGGGSMESLAWYCNQMNQINQMNQVNQMIPLNTAGGGSAANGILGHTAGSVPTMSPMQKNSMLARSLAASFPSLAGTSQAAAISPAVLSKLLVSQTTAETHSAQQAGTSTSTSSAPAAWSPHNANLLSGGSFSAKSHLANATAAAAAATAASAAAAAVAASGRHSFYFGGGAASTSSGVTSKPGYFGGSLPSVASSAGARHLAATATPASTLAALVAQSTGASSNPLQTATSPISCAIAAAAAAAQASFATQLQLSQQQQQTIAPHVLQALLSMTLPFGNTPLRSSGTAAAAAAAAAAAGMDGMNGINEINRATITLVTSAAASTSTGMLSPGHAAQRPNQVVQSQTSQFDAMQRGGRLAHRYANIRTSKFARRSIDNGGDGSVTSVRSSRGGGGGGSGIRSAISVTSNASADSSIDLPDPIQVPSVTISSEQGGDELDLEATRGANGLLQELHQIAIIKDGFYMPWALKLGTRDRNQLIRAHSLSSVAGKRLVKASRRYKQNLSQRRSKAQTRMKETALSAAAAAAAAAAGAAKGVDAPADNDARAVLATGAGVPSAVVQIPISTAAPTIRAFIGADTATPSAHE